MKMPQNKNIIIAFLLAVIMVFNIFIPLMNKYQSDSRMEKLVSITSEVKSNPSMSKDQKQALAKDLIATFPKLKPLSSSADVHSGPSDRCAGLIELFAQAMRVEAYDSALLWAESLDEEGCAIPVDLFDIIWPPSV